MSKRTLKEPKQTAEILLKYLKTGCLPRSMWFSTTEAIAFLLNKPIAELSMKESYSITKALIKIEKRYTKESKLHPGIARHSPVKGSPFEIDLITILPDLKEEKTIPIPDDLSKYCYDILGIEPTDKLSIPTDEDIVDFIWDLPSAKIVHSPNENDLKNGVFAALNMIRIFQSNRTEYELKLFLEMFGRLTNSCLINCCGAKVSYLCGILAGITFIDESLFNIKNSEGWEFAMAVDLSVTAYMPAEKLKKQLNNTKE